MTQVTTQRYEIAILNKIVRDASKIRDQAEELAPVIAVTGVVVDPCKDPDFLQETE